MALEELKQIEKNIDDVDFDFINRNLKQGNKRKRIPGDRDKIASEMDCSVSLVYKVLTKEKVNWAIVLKALEYVEKNLEEQESVVSKFQTIKRNGKNAKRARA